MATIDEITQFHTHATSILDSPRLRRSTQRFKILKPTSRAFIASLIVHGIILLILSTFLVANIRPPDESMAVTFLKTSAPPKPKIRQAANENCCAANRCDTLNNFCLNHTNTPDAPR